MINGINVNSGSVTLAGMYGRKVVRNGLSGLNPMRSGNSCAAAASPGVITSLDISSDLRTSLAKSEGDAKGKTDLTLHAAAGKGQSENRAEGWLGLFLQQWAEGRRQKALPVLLLTACSCP